MSASGRWNSEGRETEESEPTPTRIIPTASPDERVPLDLDRLQMTVDAIGARITYLVGVIGGAPTFGVMFGAWAGFLLLIVAGGIPASYQMRKAHQRDAARTDREAQARYRVKHEGLVPGLLTAPPVRTLD